MNVYRHKTIMTEILGHIDFEKKHNLINDYFELSVDELNELSLALSEYKNWTLEPIDKHHYTLVHHKTIIINKSWYIKVV